MRIIKDHAKQRATDGEEVTGRGTSAQGLRQKAGTNENASTSAQSNAKEEIVL